MKGLLFASLLATASIAFATETRYYGAIDLGSKGVKSALYSLEREAEGRDARVLFADVENTSLFSSMKDGNFTPGGIDEASRAAKKLMDALHSEAEKRQLKFVDYFIVGSSGVAAVANKNDLAKEVKSSTDIDMEFIDARAEGYYGLVSSIRPKWRRSSIIIDIGSGNTKLGCVIGEPALGNYHGGEIKYGSVSLSKVGEKINPSNVASGIDQAIRNEVAPAYRKTTEDVPCLANRSRLYWIGGAAWATATFMRPERSTSGFVLLSRNQINTFINKLKDGSWNRAKPSPRFDSDVPPAVRKTITTKAEDDAAKVGDTFHAEQLVAGVSIMKAILEASNPSAVVLFSRNGNFLYGYTLAKYKLDKDSDEDR